MSNSGVNTGFAKCFIFFMAITILLQGTVYLGLSIWGTTLRKCSKETADISNNPLQFVMDLIYFLNEDCGNPSVILPELSESITVDLDFSEAKPVQNRTLIILITYAVISSLWIITSLTIIAALCGPITKTVYCFCFWPWFLVIIAGCILDAVATGYHIYDIINTTSVEKTFKYLSITTSEKIIEALSKFGIYFVIPATIMACVSSRIVFIWLLNIFGSSFCVSLSNTLSQTYSSKQCSINSLASTSTYPIGNLQPAQPGHEVSDAETQQVNCQSEPALPPLRIESRQEQSQQLNQRSRFSNEASISNSHSTASYGNESHTNIEVVSNTDNAVPHLDKLNQILQRNTSLHYKELSLLSPLNDRYSTTNESLQIPMESQRVSEGLRGQLPWSYTSMPPPVPKKPQMQVYPEIPPPDYGH